MASPAVHWHEGQLIGPQHFQAAERAAAATTAAVADLANVAAYGLRAFEIETAALRNWRFSVRRCRARLREGTVVDAPGESTIADAVIPRETFGSVRESVMIYLAVPRLTLGRVNVAGGDDDAADGPPEPRRFVLDDLEIEDENRPGYPVPVQVRRTNAFLLIGDAEIGAYETLPLARLRLATDAEAVPTVDETYIPPLLACEAWEGLRVDVLKAVADTMAGRAEEVAAEVVDKGINLESGHAEDPAIMTRLMLLNTASAMLHNIPKVAGVHPFVAYERLCEIVGMVAVMRPDWNRTNPTYPVYDHDDLAGCFHRVRDLLLRDPGQKTPYEKRVFEGAGLQMQAKIDSDWFTEGWQFFLGVESSLRFAQVQSLLMQRLALKVGASDAVDALYLRAAPGVEPLPLGQPPRELPGGDWTYWQLQRGSNAWERVEMTHSVAIRFNEKQVVGLGRQGLTGLRKISVRVGDELLGLTFALFALPPRDRD